MHFTNSLTEKILLFLKLFTPMALTQFSLLAGTFVAVFLTGQYGTADLAGVSIGYNIWIACFMGIMGTLLGITPIISHQLGAKKTDDMGVIIHHGLYLATIFTVLLFIAASLFLEPVLHFLNLEPAAYTVCLNYLLAFSIGIPPIFWVCPLRNSVDAHGYTHYSMCIMIASFFVSSFINYALIGGNFGFPALGGMGAGFGTAAACWFNFIIYSLIMLFKKPFKDYKIYRQWPPLTFTYLREQLKLGIPIGLSIFCEGSIFSVAGLLMAHFGTEIIAAHQAAISFTNLFYCFPLSISMASTIVVAYELGANNIRGAYQYSNIARITAIIIAITICSYSFTHMNTIAHLFTKNDNMVDLIVTFLGYAVFFSVIDAFGTPLQGILRGYKDVKIISYIAIGSYWGICFPLAYVCSHFFGFGPYGVWIGLLTSVAVAGILYTIRVFYIQHYKFKSST